MIPPLIPSEIIRFQSLNVGKLSAWVGVDPYSWAESLEAGLGNRFGLSSTPFTRSSLRAVWANSTIPTEACFLSTMAWGGMQRGNGRRAWAARENWLPVCQDLRAGRHSRSTGYAAFSALRADGRLPGMGPAYFTKLLFFADPKADAYILDQWTARSIHLLTGQGQYPGVRKDQATAKKAALLGAPTKMRLIVDDSVSFSDYLDYCLRVEELGLALNMHPHAVEERLFSAGGRHPHPWRAYVMSAWNHSTPSLYP
ncbi:hypothetical protein [Ectopseudomonas mendocina]|uniref:8-oxoguanine DNA glycosylase OGG fold protein n=1 Tax=Ectopseudomonas mendocina TaxID=300 RepID=UPI0026BA8BFB